MTHFIETCIAAASVGSLYALAATGIALIYGVMRLMNFAHGEVIMVGAYALLVVSGVPWPLQVVATLVVAAVVAMAIERSAYRPVRQASNATLLVTSFAVAACLQNLVILIAGSRPKTISVFPGLANSVNVGGVSVGLLDLVTIVVAGAALVGLTALLHRSLIGMQLRAASENFAMARLLGIRADRTISIAFGISGILAGMVALLLMARTGNLFPALGLTPIIFGFVATIMGGMGSVRGAVAGGFLLGAMQIVLQEVLPESVRPYRDAFLFGIVIFVLVARPQGLLPSRLAEARA